MPNEPIQTLGDLKTEIASTINRGDLTTLIPKWIHLAYTDIKSRFTTNDMEKSATFSFTEGDPEVSLPTDFYGLRRMEYTVSSGDVREITIGPLSPITADEASQRRGYPNLIAIRGDGDGDTTNTLVGQLSPVPVISASGTIYYYRTIPNFDYNDDTDTNWVLTDFPNVWLYGACLQAVPKLGGHVRSELWAQYYMAGIENIKAVDKTKRFNKAPKMRSALNQ